MWAHKITEYASGS